MVAELSALHCVHCRRILSEEPYFPERLSANCCDLLTSLLTKNPEKRLGVAGIEEVKCHPWFKVAGAMEESVSDCVKLYLCTHTGCGLG